MTKAEIANEIAKTTGIDKAAVNDSGLVNAGGLCDFIRYFCFSHFLYCSEFDEF